MTGDDSLINVLLFISVCCVSLILLMTASRSESKPTLIAGILLLSFVAGFRASDVGIDTMFYYEAFVTDFGLRPWQFKDEGFRLLVRGVMWLTHSPETVFFLVSLATNSLIVARLWDFRDRASFSFMAFLYIAIFYIGTMNTMRQYLAVAILFFATRYLEKRQYLPFVIGLAVATSIHTTAIMGIAFLFIYLWINASRKTRVYIGLVAAIVVPCTIYGIILYEIGNINNYFSSSIQNANLTFLYRAGIFVLACLLMATTKSAQKNPPDEMPKTPAALVTFLSLAASSAGMYFDYLSRLGYYFAMFELVFWGMAVRRKEWDWLYYLMPSVYALYAFTYELLYNGSGIFPFHFFFN